MPTRQWTGKFHYAWIVFAVAFVTLVGAAVAAWGAGFLRDSSGSYQSAFMIAGVGCMIAAYGASQMRGDRSVAVHEVGEVTVQQSR